MDFIAPDCIKEGSYDDAEKAQDCWLNHPGISPDDIPTENEIQANWDLPPCKKMLNTLISEVDNPTDTARLKAISQPHASDWLEALPSSSLGLKMDNQLFRISCALRLGTKICHQHSCICGKNVHPNGIHGLSCQKSAGRHPRHSHTNDLIKRALVSCDTASIREPQGVSRIDGKRPDGMTLYPWKNGKLLLWDFTCVDSLAPSHVDKSAKEPGKAANEAEANKIKHYESLSENYHFVPVCIETFGVFGDIGMSFIKEIGKKVSEKTGEKRSTSFLFQALGMAVQRGNAMSILGTIKPDPNDLHELFLL